MNFDHKITDLKFHINKLVSKDVCKYFIDFYENNNQHATFENSYKFKSKQNEYDNYKCINLTKLSLDNKNFKQPLDLAKKYINLIKINYCFYIQKNICPSFDLNVISNYSSVRILKYDKGHFIKDHIDLSGLIRASCTLNLNEDYEGGDFRFFDGRVKHSFKTGDAMIFPAEPIWIHGTEPITKGTRYAINCFLEQ